MHRASATALVIVALIDPSTTAFAQEAPRDAAKTALEERAKKLADRDERWKAAQQFYTDGKLVEALDRLGQMAPLDKELFGEKSDEHADTLAITARIYLDRQAWAEARDTASQVLALREQLHANQDWHLIDARLLAADIEQREKLSPEQRRRVAQARHDQAELQKLTNDGRYRESLPIAERALATFRDILGPDHWQVAETLGWLAFDHHKLGDLKTADELYDEDTIARRKAVGELHPDFAKTLHLHGLLRAEMGDAAGTAKLYRHMLDIQKVVLGEKHPDYALGLFRLGEIYYSRLGRPALAETVWLEALAIYEQPPAEELRWAIVANNLASIYKQRAEYARAEGYYLRAIDIWKKRLGESHAFYATGLDNLAAVYYEQADYARAEPLMLQALEIRRKTLGESHPDFATSLNNLASFYQGRGAFEKAEPLFRQVVAISLKNGGEQTADYATSLNNLGGLYNDLGDFAQAEPLFRQSLEIRQQVLGEGHPDYALSLNNLAGVYKEMGDYGRAEPYYRQALELNKQAQGDGQLQYASSLNNMASLHEHMEDFASAEPLYLQALAIDKKLRGESHPRYLTDLGNLALLYKKMGNFERAEKLYLQILEARKRVHGEMHIDYALVLNNLAVLYLDKGDFAKAEPCLAQVLAIRKQLLGESSVDYAGSLNNQAEMYREMGSYSQAETKYRQAIDVLRKTLGEQHPQYALTVENLAALYMDRGDYARAEPLARQALDVTMRQLQQISGTTSERQQLLMVAGCASSLEDYLWICLRAGKAGESVYPLWLEWKGQVVRRQRQLHALTDQPGLKPQFDGLDRVNARLAHLALAVPAPAEADAVRRELSELSEKKELLEKKLAAQSKEFLASLKVATLAELQAALPTDAVLVDFADFNSRSVQAAKPDPAKTDPDRREGQQGTPRPTTTWGRRLAAFVVKHTGSVKLIDLGSASEVTAAIDTWRKGFGTSAAGQQAGELLRSRIWDPLEGEFAGASLVLVSPDGTLGKLPFAALPGKTPGSYLLEEWPIAVIPTPSSLPELAAAPVERTAADRLLVVADVDYDQATEAEPRVDPNVQLAAAAPVDKLAAAETRTRGPAGDTSGIRWSALPGTRDEGQAIAQLYAQRFGSDKVLRLTGSAATEEMLRRDAPRCGILHLATHGFFAPPQFRSALHSQVATDVTAAGEKMLSNQSVTSFHPGVLSGLVLAGANRSRSERADGYLTAEEVMSLDLRGARLCVLSACETGLGQVAGGEGLFGLQRAFQAAGARTVVASLWQVPDAATRTLMERFYANLWRSKSPLPTLAALREAQLWMLHEGGKPLSKALRGLEVVDDQSAAATDGRLSPYYWAAFVMSGDWR